MKSLHPSVNVVEFKEDSTIVFWRRESYFLERSLFTVIGFVLLCLGISFLLWKFTSPLWIILPVIVILWTLCQHYRDIQECKVQKGKFTDSLYQELLFFKEAEIMLQSEDAPQSIPPVMEDLKEWYDRMNFSIGEEYSFQSVINTGGRLRVYNHVFKLAGILNK